MHGAEMIGRWVIFKPKDTASQAFDLAAELQMFQILARCSMPVSGDDGSSIPQV